MTEAVNQITKEKYMTSATTKLLLGKICQCILFIHAFTGCDTTSQFCVIAKGTCFSKLVKSKALQKLARRFYLRSKPKVEVEMEGLNTIKILYSVKANEKMFNFRYKRLLERILKANNFVKPERFPPTEVAARFHSYRFYLQVQQWLDPENIDLLVGMEGV